MTDREEVVAVIDELLDGWERLTHAENRQARQRRSQHKREPVGIATVSAVLALTAYQHSAVRRLRPHMEGRLLPPDYAVVRAVFEAALTTIWLAKDPDAIHAWINEMGRNRTNLEKDAALSVQFRGVVGNIDTLSEVTSGVSVTPELGAEARSVEKLAKRVGIADGYVLYRLLCENTHPTVGVADDYLSTDSEGAFRFHPNADSGPDASDAWLHVLAACLLWCARLLNHWDTPEGLRNSRRRELRGLAQRLGIRLEVDLLPRGPSKP